MRYHWGLGVGHLHAHRPASTSESYISDGQRDQPEEDPTQFTDLELDDSNSEDSLHLPDADDAFDVYDSDNPELGLDDRELEGWQDVVTDSGSDVDDPSEHESESEEDFVGT
jgi:hypothetical protein